MPSCGSSETHLMKDWA